MENPIYDFFRVNLKIYLELGVSHWREICIEMKEILLFANSLETEFLEKNILFAREKGRRERKIGGEREEEEEEKKELPRV